MEHIETEYVDTEGAERLTSTPKATLATLRARGGGPAYIKRGRKVLYALADLRLWLNAAKRQHSSEG